MTRLRAAAEKTAPRSVTLDDVVKMAALGVPEDAILETIKAADGPFQITAEQWLDLVRNGVSPQVLKALRDEV